MLCVASDSVATRLGEPERAHTRAALTEFHPELLRAEELRLLENRRENASAGSTSVDRKVVGWSCLSIHKSFHPMEGIQPEA
jgi:hypothetical protein